MTAPTTLAAFFASERVHGYDPNYVFPDGVRLEDAANAVAAAGLASNYVLANELKIRYALDLCSRCGGRQIRGTDKPPATLMEYGIDAFGTICSVCDLNFLAMGRTKRRL